MYVLNVVPIQKGFPLESLSYFSSQELQPGACVSIPIQKRTVPGLVVGIRFAHEVKRELKKDNAYTIRNIEKVLPYTLPKKHIAIAIATANYFCVPINDVLAFLFPDHASIIDGSYPLPPASLREYQPIHDRSALQLGFDDRMGWYRTYVRQSLARGISVHIFCPTIASCETVARSIERGISERIVVLHGSLTPKERSKRIKRVVEIQKKDGPPITPLVIVSTSTFLPYIHAKTGAFIIEEEGSHQYKTAFRPRIDVRHLIELFAFEYRFVLILGDSILSMATQKRLRDREINYTVGLRVRLDDKDKVSILAPTILDGERIHPRTISCIEEAKANGEKILIIVPRRGLASLTLCTDCGHIVSCPVCKTPLVLHEKRGDHSPRRLFICHVCTMETEVRDVCLSCGSWRMTPYGVGTQRIHAAFKEQFPHFDLSTVDDESLDTKKNREVMLRWYSSPGALLIGTPSLVPYLSFFPPDEVHFVGFDNYFSYPSYMMNEHMLHFSVGLIELAKKRVYLYATETESRVKNALLSSFLTPAIREELREREQFNLPPYSVIVKLDIDIPSEQESACVEVIEYAFQDYPYDIFRSNVRKKTVAQSVTTVIVTIPEERWNRMVDQETMRDILDDIRQYATIVGIEINPEQLF